MTVLDHPRYEPRDVLGEGAQGIVVRVIDRERPDVPLVAKVWRGVLAPGAEAAMRAEFALLSRTRSPGLVRAHDLGRDRSGRSFLVEDFAPGEEPIAWCHRGSLAARVASLAASLAETLATLHDAGFVHGDVKPANIRVAPDGSAKLLDLGAVVRVREASAAFTRAFAAPEILAGAPPSPASDMYALGATLYACVTRDVPPAKGGRSPLRARARAFPPSLAAIVDALSSDHPSDRPASGRDVLRRLGKEGERPAFESAAPRRHVRERDVNALLAAAPGVTYLVGPSGSGKSHLGREVVTRALLAGRTARLVRFPADDPTLVARLVAFFRTDERSWPFEHAARRDALVVLDDLDRAPAELAAALDAYRCRMHASRRSTSEDAAPCFVATVRDAPSGAPVHRLGPLEGAAFDALATELGVPAAARAALAAESGGLPGWAVASIGRVPLDEEAALARVTSLPAPAREELALVACMGGIVPARIVDRDRAAPAMAEGLLGRADGTVRLATPSLAADLAHALADFAIADRAATHVLDDPGLPAAIALAVAGAPSPPERRAEVLAVAAARARDEGARGVEIDALLALLASPDARTGPRIARLERLTRDAGVARAHPQVLAWLEEASTRDPSLACLALRRRADDLARRGESADAKHTADRALAAATSTIESAWALATRGAVALFSADYASAHADLAEAHARADAARAIDPSSVDAEEHARLEHNLGVVALYRGHVDDAARAFETSLALKRALGDRAGARACLLNLGLAEAKRGRLDEADAALVEAVALAEALEQRAGKGWCLTARADVALRRRHARDAEAFVAEARTVEDALPPAVRADLALIEAAIAIFDGDGPAAARALAAIDATVRAEDALVDARALVLEGRSALATPPVDRRAAARKGIAAARRARAAGLPEPADDALALVRAARHHEGAIMTSPREPASVAVDPAWSVVHALAASSAGDAVRVLAKLVLDETRAERVFVWASPDHAWGVDVDGLALGSANERIDRDLLAASRASDGIVYRADVVANARRGSQLAVAASDAAVIVEHRFVPHAFDHVTPAMAARWSALAAVAGRIARSAAPAVADLDTRAPTPHAFAPITSTASPVRELAREYPTIVGRSETLRRALAALDAAVDSELPVLIHGETGTGKELFARALHDEGARSRAPFVAVNCAAIPDSLFEAELFGHARGAFTGADRARPGLLARAEGGTLFLDEIGELPLARQATLLRVLESRRYRSVGADDERAFDVRIVAATNRDLDACVVEGTFRQDLLYRLRVLEIAVPPLRARADDVALLVEHFFARAGAPATLAPSALAVLRGYAFPGNVRELSHLVQRLSAQRIERVEAAHLPRAIRAKADVRPRLEPEDARAEVERALADTGGNISRAATRLGLTRHGLKKRMLRLGVRPRTGTA